MAGEGGAAPPPSPSPPSAPRVRRDRRAGEVGVEEQLGLLGAGVGGGASELGREGGAVL